MTGPGNYGPGCYYVVAEDKARREHLVIEILVDGPATVIGRFNDPDVAEAEAKSWTRLEMECAA
jgi:hypothetical protein